MRALMLAGLAALFLAGCGDPRSSVHVENRDFDPYIIVVSGPGLGTTVLSLPQSEGGNVMNEPADIVRATTSSGVLTVS